MHDERLLDVLDQDECRRLLHTMALGRLVFTEDSLPAVQPVAFAVDGGEIYIPTHEGSKVAVASRGAVVAFEVDDFDLDTRTGWNVTVVGPSRVISDPSDVAHLDRLGVRPWAPADTHCYVGVQISVVRGRRLRLAEPAAPAGPVT